MLVKLRDNLYLGDTKASKDEQALKAAGITSVIVVADDLALEPLLVSGLRYWQMGLRSDRMNPPFTKDLVAHSVKYSMQNGETMLVQSVTGLQRGAYIACRVLCELENKTIYEIMQELKELVPEFDINKSYF